MSEDFLQFVWQFQLHNRKLFKLSTGENIEIINPGTKNTDAGPDFFDARVKIENTLWAGNVEIHVKASDWNQHKHCENKAYDNVVLQVVKYNDCVVKRSNGEVIPTIELTFDNYLFENYQELLDNQLWVACQDRIKQVDSIYINQWLGKLSIQRLEDKSAEIIERLKQNKNNWEETFYQFLAKNFGFKVNSVPFEMLAKSLPLNYLGKHKNNLFHIEAMLFGQAGMLERSGKDEYNLLLQNEYLFFKKKFNLTPMNDHLWKFLRLRPSNFPTIRIAQFAFLIYKSSKLFSKILESDSFEELKTLFDIFSSDYWENHYVFGKDSVKRKKNLGEQAFNTIVINTVVPFTFVYGKFYGNEEYKDKALNWLENIPAEKNSIVKKWKDIGVNVKNAFYSQALLQLKNIYCNQKKCLNCSIGNKVIKFSE